MGIFDSREVERDRELLEHFVLSHVFDESESCFPSFISSLEMLISGGGTFDDFDGTTVI